MPGIFTGVLANALLVIVGAAAGLIFKTEKLRLVGERVFQIFALYVIVMGVEGALGIERPLLVLASLIAGVAAGELIDLDGAFKKLASGLRERFAKDEGERFAAGFVQASLLFCIGSMTIMGALESGLENRHSIYFTKGVLDMISAMTLSMGYGIGAAFSALSVLIYQGLLTLLASVLSPILSPEIAAASTQIGSLSLIGIALNMLGLTKLKVANFLPAMFVPLLYRAFVLLAGI